MKQTLTVLLAAIQVLAFGQGNRTLVSVSPLTSGTHMFGGEKEDNPFGELIVHENELK